MANLDNAQQIRSVAHGEGWALEVWYGNDEKVVLATYATEKEAEDLRRHLRYYVHAESIIPVEPDFAPATPR